MLIGRGIIALFTVLSLGGAIGGFELISRANITAAVTAVGTFIETPSVGLFSYDRIVFLLILVFAFIVIFESIFNRNRPVSVLSSELRLDFLDPRGENLKVSRTQYLRANQPNVTAYYTATSTDFGGTIPRDRVSYNAFVGDKQINNRIDIPPTVGASRLEITHIFDDGMPFKIWNVLIPEFVLRFIVRHDIAKLNFIVRRDLSWYFLNEHVLSNTYYEATAERYVQKNVKIVITFHPARPCQLSGGILMASIVKRSGMKQCPFRTTGAYCHEYTFKKLQNEKVHVPLRF